MIPTAEGGKDRAIKTGYRPNHVFEIPTDPRNLQTYIGEIQMADGESIAPGETKIVTIKFLRHPAVEPYLKVGQKWFINEAAWTVGYGEILEI